MDRQPNLSLLPPVNVFELAHVNAGMTIGLAYLGVAISAVLYGITCCQTFNYYRSTRGSKDGWFYKGMVAVIGALDTFHQVLVLYAFYHYLVLNFANPIALMEIFWPVPASFIANTILGGIVHTYLIYRVWTVTGSMGERRPWVIAVCGIWLVVSMTMDLAYPIRQFSFSEVLAAELESEPLAIAALCIVVSKDAFVAGLLSFFLYKKRGPTTKNVITNLIILTICTGALTTCFELASLIAYVLAPESLFDLFFNMMLGKLYANSFLTILNTREVISGKRKTDEEAIDSALRRAGHDLNMVKSDPDELFHTANQTKTLTTTGHGTITTVILTTVQEDDDWASAKSVCGVDMSIGQV